VYVSPCGQVLDANQATEVQGHVVGHPNVHPAQLTIPPSTPRHASYSPPSAQDYSSVPAFDDIPTYTPAAPQPDLAVSPSVASSGGHFHQGGYYTTLPYMPNPEMSDPMVEEELAAAAVLKAHNSANSVELTQQPHQNSSVTADGDDIGQENIEPFAPRRGYTHKRAEEPPKNEQGKMTCKFQTTCAGVTFDRKCEWR
jgi:hypothetical protein